MTSTPRFRVFQNHDSASAQIASEMAVLIRERAILGRTVVLGIAEHPSLIPLHQELAYLHREEGLSFRNVVLFLVAEYLGLPAGHPAELRHSLQHSLLNHINVLPENIHSLSSRIAESEVARHCSEYEKQIAAAGGLDLVICGLGRNGRIGFNEPGTPETTQTRRVALSEMTRRDAIRAFKGISAVPTAGLTMGFATILQARRVFVLACGSRKARIVQRALLARVSPTVPASCLQAHPAAHFFLNRSAAARVSPDQPSEQKPATGTMAGQKMRQCLCDAD